MQHSAGHIRSLGGLEGLVCKLYGHGTLPDMIYYPSSVGMHRFLTIFSAVWKTLTLVLPPTLPHKSIDVLRPPYVICLAKPSDYMDSSNNTTHIFSLSSQSMNSCLFRQRELTCAELLYCNSIVLGTI